MDNQNNPNSPNDQNPASPFGAPAQPISNLNSFPSQATAPIPAEPSIPQPSPTPNWPPSSQPPAPADLWPAPPQPVSADPLSSNPTPPAPPPWPSDLNQPASTPQQPNIDPLSTPTGSTNSLGTEPAQPLADPAPAASEQINPWQTTPQPNNEAAVAQPPDNLPAYQDQPSNSTNSQAPWQSMPTPPQAETEPVPTFVPPQATPQPDNNPAIPQPSSLDNPLGAPSNPSPVDGSQTVQPSWNMPGNPTPDQAQTHPAESTPTDLSHLITNNPQPFMATGQEATQPVNDSVIVPSATAPNPEVPNLPTGGHKGIPRWLIGLGAGLLVLVIGASAYFILGIGQPPKTASLPATTEQETTQAKPPMPAVTTAPIAQPSVQPQPSATASGSANFGQLGGSTGTNQATSAADLLRQRQQQGI